jgi:hypothetical protein
MINNDLKIKTIKIFLWIAGVFLFFWWPLSHWFYPDLYHQLLGFVKGSYQDNMVKIIGTTGILPVLMAILSAINPYKNKDMIIILIIFSFLMAFTYLFLIITNQFPKLEYINVAIPLFSAVFLLLFYPWNNLE